VRPPKLNTAKRTVTPNPYQKEKVELIYGFFQDLLSQDLFDSSKVFKAENEFKMYLNTFQQEYANCQNVIRFCKIEKVVPS
jgi:hypothetical protein